MHYILTALAVLMFTTTTARAELDEKLRTRLCKAAEQLISNSMGSADALMSGVLENTDQDMASVADSHGIDLELVKLNNVIATIQPYTVIYKNLDCANLK